MTSSPPELRLLAAPRPSHFRLPRTPGSGRTVAPAVPFVPPSPVLSVARSVGAVTYEPGTARLSVRCPETGVAALAARWADTGLAGWRVTVEIDGWPGPAVSARTVRELADLGVAALVVVGDGPTGAELPDWFELGKAALAYDLPVHWTGRLPAGAAAAAVHLTPPRNDPSWRADWRFGLLTWRRGPGFVRVEDARDMSARQHLVMDLGILAETFGAGLDRHAAVSDIDPVVLADLVDAEVVAVFADRAVWLPYRLRRWPVTSEVG